MENRTKTSSAKGFCLCQNNKVLNANKSHCRAKKKELLFLKFACFLRVSNKKKRISRKTWVCANRAACARTKKGFTKKSEAFEGAKHTERADDANKTNRDCAKRSKTKPKGEVLHSLFQTVWRVGWFGFEVFFLFSERKKIQNTKPDDRPHKEGVLFGSAGLQKKKSDFVFSFSSRRWNGAPKSCPFRDVKNTQKDFCQRFVESFFFFEIDFTNNKKKDRVGFW